MTATGGNPGDSYNYSETGTLPRGLGLSSSGQLSGTPTQAGSYTFTVTATDTSSPGLLGRQSYTLIVGLQLSPGALLAGAWNLPPGVLGSSYTQGLTASGGSGSYTFTSPAGALPPGLQLVQAGTQAQLTGTLAQVGTYTFAVTATVTYTGIDPSTKTFTGRSNPGGDDGDTLNAKGSVISATQDLPALTLSVASTSGFAPSGGTLVVQTTTGTALVTCTGTAGNAFTGCSGGTGAVASDFLVSSLPGIGTAPVTLSPPVLPAGTVAVPYQPDMGKRTPEPPPYQITATGGTGRYTYQVSAGTLPPGIFLSPVTGELTDASGSRPGTPTQVGTFAFTVTATDSGGATAGRPYSITMIPTPPGRSTPQQIR